MVSFVSLRFLSSIAYLELELTSRSGSVCLPNTLENEVLTWRKAVPASSAVKFARVAVRLLTIAAAVKYDVDVQRKRTFGVGMVFLFRWHYSLDSFA